MTIIGSYEFNLEDEYDPVSAPPTLQQTIIGITNTMINLFMIVVIVHMVSGILKATKRK